MILKESHEYMLKEYAFEMIRIDGEETFAKMSKINYGYTNGLHKLHYLVLAIEFKKYRNIVSQLKEREMQVNVGLNYLVKVSRKSSRRMLTEAFKKISEQDADRSIRAKRQRIKRMINAIMKNLPLFINLESIFSKKLNVGVKRAFRSLKGSERESKLGTLDTVNYVAQKIIKKLLFKRYFLSFEQIKHAADARKARVALAKVIKISRRFAKMRVKRWREATKILKEEENDRRIVLDTKMKLRVLKELYRFTKRMQVLKVIVEDKVAPILGPIGVRRLKFPFECLKQYKVKLKLVSKEKQRRATPPDSRSRDITPRGKKDSFIFDSKQMPIHHRKTPSNVSSIVSTFGELATPRRNPYNKP